jgi:hypothetical protein
MHIASMQKANFECLKGKLWRLRKVVAGALHAAAHSLAL